MEFKTQKDGTGLTIDLIGELNTVTAPELSALLDKELPGVETLTLNFKECEYISSAGLRVLLATHKSMKASGGVMQLTDVGEVFLDVLENTGLDGVFKIV